MASADTLSKAPIKVGEFTRRKNWSQSILDELRDWMHVLESDYSIIYGSPASSECFGYSASEMTGHLMTEFIHVDDRDSFARAFLAARDTMEPFRAQYRMHTKGDEYVIVETTGHFHKRSFFGSARVLPVDATNAMETFLDLRMEHEALQQRLRLLKQQQQQQQQQEQEEDDQQQQQVGSPNVYAPGGLGGVSVSDSVSLFTGLHFEAGERARGISMGDMSQSELFQVAGNPPPPPPTIVQRPNIIITQQRNNNKKKRIDAEQQQQQQRICTECQTTDSPEWRKGPMGSKTLCNACGLRWSKTQKKP
ncbi:hypothetical protein O0I10_012137 [Lichtheimia ornata]|uniref:Uncharacterized protein n=1 Tax=Lichtheimia ornata TaxID=688661 RepID=A0AAD7UT40_9FUNG|nr:uncharacterized protein O0I10_012137 [Lichtheimia ornata]KAJ8652229.1 hypothetical protein O0I10_012137 [Lichtheimia ornata]